MKNILAIYKVNENGLKSLDGELIFEYEFTPEKIWNILIQEISKIINKGNKIYCSTLSDISKTCINTRWTTAK